MRTVGLSIGALLGLAGILAAQQPDGRPLSIPELESLAQRDSNDATVHYRLAMAYWDKKRWDEAERALREAIVVAPGYADAHLAIGVLPLRRGKEYWQDRVKKEGEEKIKHRPDLS